MPPHSNLQSPAVKESTDDHISLPTQFIKDLAEAGSIPEITDRVAEWFSRIFRADRASITLLECEHQLVLIALKGNQAIPMGVTLPVEGTMIGRVVSSGKIEYCRDLSTSSDIDCISLFQGNILSCLDAPLVGGGNCFGTINVGRSTVDGFTKADQNTLEALANLISALMYTHRQSDQLRQLADLDPLTSLMNRRSFIRQYNSILTGKSIPSEIGVALIDIDHFKAVNDSYGHSFGDHVLVNFSTIFTTSFRQSDLLARFGGEEFCLVVIGVSSDDFKSMLARFLKTLKNMPIETSHGLTSITASIGALHLQEFSSSFDEIYQKIDSALYCAKHNGRDQIKFSS